MTRATAIIVTILTALLCGLPSLLMLCIGAFALLGTQMPEVMAQNPESSPGEVMFGSWILICFGVVLLIVPILVGFFSFRLSATEAITDMTDPLP